MLFACFTFSLPDLPLDEKNGQLSRQPSTPSRQNSRRSESGSERERVEKERVADGGSGSSSSSSSGTNLQRPGSVKDKTRLLSSSNGTQSHPWEECCGRDARVISLAFFSLPSFRPSHILSFPASFLPALLPAIIPKQWDLWGWSWSRDMMEKSPLMADFSGNVYLWQFRRRDELMCGQPSRAASPQRDKSKDRMPNKVPFCKKSTGIAHSQGYSKLTCSCGSKAHSLPTKQSHATHGSDPTGILPSVNP